MEACIVREKPYCRGARCASRSIVTSLWMFALSGAVLTHAPLASAQVDAPATWTEPQVVRRAVSRAPDVQNAQAAVISAQAVSRYGQVPFVGNPTLSLRMLFDVGNVDRTASTYAAFVGFPIDISGYRGLYRREAVWAAQAAQAQLDAAANDARARARTAYADVAVADAQVRTASQRVEAAREFLSRTQARARAQAATALDLSLSERELGEAEANLAAARRDREEAAGRLREILDLPGRHVVSVEPVGVPGLPPGVSRERAIALAAERRRETLAYQHTAYRLSATAERSRAQAIAPLVVAGEAEVQSNRYLGVGGSVSWQMPFFQLAQGDRAVALAQSAAADVQRALSSRGVGREAATAWDQLVLQLEELRALDERSLPAAERTVALTESLFESGAADYFRVLLARQALAETRARRLTALRDAWRSRIALDRAMGGE